MAHQNECTQIEQVMELLTTNGFDDMARVVEILVNGAMRLQRSGFLEAGPYERSPERRGYANGFKPKTLKSRFGELRLQIPQVRDVEDGESFYPPVLERGERSERALKLALAEMYVQGVSTRKVAAITKELCGFEVSSAQVSRAAACLDVELEAWRTRPLGRMKYMVLDARYEKVRHGGQVISEAVLIAIGIDMDGRRSVLGVSVSLSEAEVHWREFLSSLRKRGLHGMEMITSDNHEGLKAGLRAAFPGVAWNRCQVHLQRNAQSHAPRKEMRKKIAEELRDVFNAPDLEEAERLLEKTVEKYRKTAPKLAEWMEHNVPEGFAVFAIPKAHRRRIRSTNLLEFVNKEIKRRTRVATLFPNDASILRLVSAVLVELSEDWETGRRYLPEETD